MGFKFSFEKSSPEEKQRKKQAKKEKRKERYGHLMEADEGSLASFIGSKLSKDKEKKKSSFIPKDKDDFSHLTEAEEGSAVKAFEDFTARMFPDKAEKKRKSFHVTDIR